MVPHRARPPPPSQLASSLDAAPALVRFAAADAAAVFTAARTARTLLLLPLRGGAARYYHASAAAATGSGPAVAKPSIVLVKVGDNGEWRIFKHDKLLELDRSDLLKALVADEMFALGFKGVNALGDCTIAAVKSELVAEGAEPEAAHEKDGSIVAMELDKTVGGLVADAHASGAPLFVRVRLPRKVSNGKLGSWGCRRRTRRRHRACPYHLCLLDVAPPTCLPSPSSHHRCASLRSCKPGNSRRGW